MLTEASIVFAIQLFFSATFQTKEFNQPNLGKTKSL